jgi:predicted RNA-binding Zn ribbon-like protein
VIVTDKKRNAGNLKLLGGRLCLDFVNTLDWRGTDSPQEFLTTYPDLVAWSRHAGICSHQEARKLQKLAEKSNSEAQQTLTRALKLRETIYRLFKAGIAMQNPPAEDLTAFNHNLSRSMKDSQIIRTPHGYAWDVSGGRSRLDWILNPVIHSAAEVLISVDRKKVKACADTACGWLFIDVSRNRSRRWCDMQDCGNRAKASRFYKKRIKDVSRKDAKAPR